MARRAPGYGSDFGVRSCAELSSQYHWICELMQNEQLLGFQVLGTSQSAGHLFGQVASLKRYMVRVAALFCHTGRFNSHSMATEVRPSISSNVRRSSAMDDVCQMYEQAPLLGQPYKICGGCSHARQVVKMDIGSRQQVKYGVEDCHPSETVRVR